MLCILQNLSRIKQFWKTLNPKQGLTAGPHWSVRGPAQPQLAHAMARRRRRSGRRRAGRRECGARPQPGRQGGFGARGGGVQPRIGAARDVRAAAGRQPRRCSCAPAMWCRKERGKEGVGKLTTSSIRVVVDRSGVEAGGRRRLSYAAVEGVSRSRGHARRLRWRVEEMPRRPEQRARASSRPSAQ